MSNYPLLQPWQQQQDQPQQQKEELAHLDLILMHQHLHLQLQLHQHQHPQLPQQLLSLENVPKDLRRLLLDNGEESILVVFVKTDQQNLKVTVRKVKNVTKSLLKIQFHSKIGLRLNSVLREHPNGNGMLKHVPQDKNNVEVTSVFQLPILVLFLNSRKKQQLLQQPSRLVRITTQFNMKLVPLS